MIEVVSTYVITASATITAGAASYAAKKARDISVTVGENEARSIANQRRQIGEPEGPETLDQPILDRVRELERRGS